GEAELVATVRDELRRRRRRRLGPVVNATGVVLHTNLGRSPLSERAIDAVASIARGYSNLEWDAEHGRRGDRYVHVEPLLALLTGAEAALVVNNNAAGVLLVCSALAAGKEVVVSRGELIEIGGEFRIPEILATSGATLREVGTTNRTHLRDYERGVTSDTAFLLKVHPSNYRVVGFTTSPSTEELTALARRRNVPLVYDVGSGLLARPLADEPLVGRAVADGADLVCFSGDKLFGGPQAGVVAGRKELVDRLRSHPLLRAIRPDKMQLAALQATVETYLEGAGGTLPLWKLLDASPSDIARRAKRLAKKLSAAGLEVSVNEGESVAGGGSLPGEAIPTTVLRLRQHGRPASELAATLRAYDPPVVVRVEEGYVVLDLRTVLNEQDGVIARAIGVTT
ncbi:MAG TPA: L-seryl-tRNA(Sec) selenium transferase, partial [Actinomycetota bacterium]|nr:L-seryl-tRNA(Sec) selenium transferase [Actinomycetota bacterium]